MAASIRATNTEYHNVRTVRIYIVLQQTQHTHILVCAPYLAQSQIEFAGKLRFQNLIPPILQVHIRVRPHMRGYACLLYSALHCCILYVLKTILLNIYKNASLYISLLGLLSLPI